MTTTAAQASCAFTGLTDLASERFGGEILFATDEWFATANNLLKPDEPVFIEGKFTSYGKWMDGWETRRKRIPGHDWCIIKLGLPGVIKGIEVDTAFFTGNNAPRFSIQAACFDPETPLNAMQLETAVGTMGTCATDNDFKTVEAFKTQEWTEVVPFHELGHGYPETRHNFFTVDLPNRWTHIRLNIFPDGGVARLRIYGHVAIDWSAVSSSSVIDLAAATNGGRAIGCSDSHYGEPRNLIGPGRGINMGDGWETARKAGRPAVLKLGSDGLLQVPGSDWAVLKLGCPGRISKVNIDTLHFKGNYPESCLIEGCSFPDDAEDILQSKTANWITIVPRTKVTADNHHIFTTEENASQQPINYVRLTIYPDGGVSRLRCFGTLNK